MKFRALNLDYHAEASFRLWEQREKGPHVIIRLLGPEEIALVSNKDELKSIVSNDAALNSLPHTEGDSPTIDMPACNVPSTIEEPEIMIDIAGNHESHEVSRQ
jgi:hypothetical protein